MVPLSLCPSADTVTSCSSVALSIAYTLTSSAAAWQQSGAADVVTTMGAVQQNEI